MPYTHHDDAPALLRQALQTMLRAAHEQSIRSLAFPAIGTGVFAFPPVLAARITAEVLAQAADVSPYLQLARLCVADPDLAEVYRSAFAVQAV